MGFGAGCQIERFAVVVDHEPEGRPDGGSEQLNAAQETVVFCRLSDFDGEMLPAQLFEMPDRGGQFVAGQPQQSVRDEAVGKERADGDARDPCQRTEDSFHKNDRRCAKAAL